MAKSKAQLLKEWKELTNGVFLKENEPTVKELEVMLKDEKGRVDVVDPGSTAPQVVIKESNFTDFEGLKREFAKGKMPERKRIALRIKLISLFKDASILEVEKDFMMLMLRREREKGELSSIDGYFLHKIESDECEEECFVKTDDAPQVHYLRKNDRCMFTKDPITDKFFVYVPKVVPPEHQLSRDIVVKEQRGHTVDPSEYPKKKILIKRLELSPKEFGAWFEVEEDNILEGGISKKEVESYTF